jgi:metallo-beta-lactamase family protein
MKLEFVGAVGTVTGSKTLVTAGKSRVLVDCGMFQGFKELRERNWQRPPFDPRQLDAVVLSHAHLDHSGWVPRLVKEGFTGPIYCTPSTHDLCKLLLMDSGYLQEEDAAYANRKGYSKHDPALPLYTQKDAERALRQFVEVDWDAPLRLTDELAVTLLPAGHILGASLVCVEDGRSRVVFSGDLGRPTDLIMKPPRQLDRADWLVLESTYGNRRHPSTSPLEQLAEVVNRTTERNGTVLVPAFAVGRTQALLRALQLLKQRKAIPDVPVWLDSPMATNATELYVRHHKEHRLTDEQAQALWKGVNLSLTAQDSMHLDFTRGARVIVSAAGMLTGGRVLHHIKAFAPDPRNTLLFSGFQAGGTRGAHILGGADEIRVHGFPVEVQCEVARIDALSAHADQQELIDWLQGMEAPPLHIYLNHGEPEAVEALRRPTSPRPDGPWPHRPCPPWRLQSWRVAVLP